MVAGLKMPGIVLDFFDDVRELSFFGPCEPCFLSHQPKYKYRIRKIVI